LAVRLTKINNLLRPHSERIVDLLKSWISSGPFSVVDIDPFRAKIKEIKIISFHPVSEISPDIFEFSNFNCDDNFKKLSNRVKLHLKSGYSEMYKKLLNLKEEIKHIIKILKIIV